ncbi:hypothetical protein C8R41DRAFT_865312 [Lentinula lateritia]|uniref:Uncharacterized protein n=1 Tax=Lentinula lateritia TaxID=40482 RepID=A0ABQ8VNA4_9AGAR|nr:hypothetical protein C8R41DRAFT_865312 [Lentinula lateritia]
MIILIQLTLNDGKKRIFVWIDESLCISFFIYFLFPASLMEQLNSILVAVLRAAQQTGIIPADYTFTASEVLEAAQQAGIISSPPANDPFPTLQGFKCFVPEAQLTDWHMNNLDLEDLLGDRISNGIIDTFQKPHRDSICRSYCSHIWTRYIPSTICSSQYSVWQSSCPLKIQLGHPTFWGRKA